MSLNEDNPVGLTDLDHLEFTVDSFDSPTIELFYTHGFSISAKAEEGNSLLFTQGQIKFLVNKNPDTNSQSRKYFNTHGEGVCTMSFRVDDCEHALKTVLARGADLVQDLKIVETEFGVIKTAIIKGFGDVHNELVERPNKIFRKGFTAFEDPKANPLKVRFSRIDHLTNNVPFGEMEKWVGFYKKVYGFKEVRYFDIKGAKTGLLSKVVQSDNKKIIIPINEPEVSNGKSQIQEFLDIHKGAGVQHIAFMTPNCIDSVLELQERGIRVLNIPDTYYEDIPKRPFKVDEDPAVLKKAKILVDGDKEGYLLQLFSETYIGPLFFEYIQRKNHWGFGEGNFQALFDAIERDQIERGYLDK